MNSSILVPQASNRKHKCINNIKKNYKVVNCQMYSAIFLRMSPKEYSCLRSMEGTGSPCRSLLVRFARRRESIIAFNSLWRSLNLKSSQILMVLSRDPDAIFEASAENDTQSTVQVCPTSVCRHSPVVTSHTLTVLSHDAETSFLP